MRVRIPSPLHSYTGAAEVEGRGASLVEVLADLDIRFPGFRFRIVDEQDRVRPHIVIFVNGTAVRDLRTAVGTDCEILIVAALSGG